MKLSIIVPVYKVEEYLDKCVESILAQTFTDFELILVDDGSPDACGQMCEDWAGKDSRIRVIHKENGGLSDARNAGIEASRGDYLGFVDSDDFIRENMFEALVSNLETYDADISLCGYADVYANGILKENTDDSVQVWSQEETIHQILLGRKLSVHAYTKLYKRRLFQNVRYPVGKISEDAYIIMDIMDQVNTAVYTPYALYYYVHREGSINTSNFRERDLTRIEAHQKNYRYVSEKYPQYRDLAYDRYLGAVAYVAGKVAMGCTPEDEEKGKPLFRQLRKNLMRIYRSSYFSRNRKLMVTLLVTSKWAYRTMYRRIRPLA